VKPSKNILCSFARPFIRRDVEPVGGAAPACIREKRRELVNRPAAVGILLEARERDAAEVRQAGTDGLGRCITADHQQAQGRGSLTGERSDNAHAIVAERHKDRPTIGQFCHSAGRRAGWLHGFRPHHQPRQCQTLHQQHGGCDGAGGAAVEAADRPSQ
jgi:hypothetical protein